MTTLRSSVADDSAASPRRKSRKVDRSGIALVFVLVVVFSYSEEIVSAAFEMAGMPEPSGWRWIVLVVDGILLAATGWLKRRIAAADGDRQHLWGWWVLGATLTVAVNLFLLASEGRINVWGDPVASTLFVAAMGILLISTLNADPMTIVSAAKRSARRSDWLRARSVVPLMSAPTPATSPPPSGPTPQSGCRAHAGHGDGGQNRVRTARRSTTAV
jgi:hypothetical protein